MDNLIEVPKKTHKGWLVFRAFVYATIVFIPLFLFWYAGLSPKKILPFFYSLIFFVYFFLVSLFAIALSWIAAIRDHKIETLSVEATDIQQLRYYNLFVSINGLALLVLLTAGLDFKSEWYSLIYFGTGSITFVIAIVFDHYNQKVRGQAVASIIFSFILFLVGCYHIFNP